MVKYVCGVHFNYMDDSRQIGSEHNGDYRGTRRATLHRQIGYLAALMRQMRFWEMQPADAMVKTGTAFAMERKWPRPCCPATPTSAWPRREVTPTRWRPSICSKCNRDPHAGTDQSHSCFFLTPGVRVSFSRHLTFTVSSPLPVLQHSNGEQLKTSYKVNAALTVSF